MTVAATTTTLRCRNSRNPACGDFRWDPLPQDDQPLQIELSMTPARPGLGEQVTFSVRVVDPDAAPIREGGCGSGPGFFVVRRGGGTPGGTCAALCDAPGFGPWTPPARVRGESTFTYRETFFEPGQYVAAVIYQSGNVCTLYASGGSKSVEFDVVDREAPTTTAA